MVQDLNRYSKHTIIVANAAVGSIIYTGTVFPRDIDDFLAALDKLFPELQVTQPDAQHVLIESRGAAPKSRF